MTLVYCGTTEQVALAAFNSLAKDAITAGRVSGALFLDVIGVEEFGRDEKVDVLRLSEPPRLTAARELVNDWDVSEHPFSPHATIGPAGSARGELPTHLYFDRIYVAWGGESMTFRLD